MNKKPRLLLIGGIAAAVLLIGAVLLTLWFTVWMPPSKEDFLEAKKTAEKIVNYGGLSQLNTFTKAMNKQYDAGKVGQDLVDSVSTEQEKVIEAVDNRNRLAEQLRTDIVLRDGEVKKEFDGYIAIEARYGVYIRNYISEYPKYLTSAIHCSKPFKLGTGSKTLKELAERHSASSKACLEDLAKLETSPFSPFTAYAKEFNSIIDERQKVLDGAVNGTIKIGDASARLQATNQKYSTIWPLDEMKNYRKEQTFDGELKRLIALLGEKAEKL